MRAGNPSGAALLAQLSVALILVFLLAEVRPLRASPGAEFTVSGSGVALRAQPRETANALLTLTPEHLLVEFERRGDWVRVGVYREVGAFGWVPADELVPAPRAALEGHVGGRPRSLIHRLTLARLLPRDLLHGRQHS